MVKVRNVLNGNGRAIPNQFLIETPEGRYFQSYQSIIAFIPCSGNSIVLDHDSWDYSVTTGKYRNMFLHETKKETERKIKSGVYILANLN